jgi:lincosamide nucleotidyltransferase A/C/D/E
MRGVGMDTARVHRVLDALAAAGCPCWISGGWGVDALVGRRTRPHRDLDLAIDAAREPDAVRALAVLGYVVETDWRPVRVELVEPGGGRVDLHPVAFEHGDGRQAGLDGAWFDYPRADLTTGTIDGRRVPCISVRLQLRFHEGYEPREVDVLDLRLLHELTARRPASGR